MIAVSPLRNNAGRVMAIGVAGFLSTLVAALTVVVFLFVVTLPTSMIVFLMPGVLIWALYFAVVWAAPVTLVLLPVTAIFLRRGIPAMIIMAIVGTIGGAISIWIWHFFTVSGKPEGIAFSLAVVVGALAGLASGGFFGRTLYELGK